jgi:MFS family permease
MPQTSRRNLVTLALSFYLILAAAVFATIWHQTSGHFTYTLDDTYIHMALAVQLSHGHYGINPGEPSSPSSSLLWPFLLVPFANRAFHLYLPLLWNLAANIASAILIGITVAEWPSPIKGREDSWFRGVAVLGLVLAGNLVGTTFLGMEHGLQVLIAIACAAGICRVLSGRDLPTWSIAAAAIAPMVRYEDLALTLAIAITLYGLNRRRAALVLLVVSVLPLIAFSVFLHSRGLPLLPLSVLVKGRVAGPHTNFILMAIHTLAAGAFYAFTDTKRWPILILFVMLATASWRSHERTRRFALAAAALAAALQLLIGRFGWLHRYEVYALVFATMIVLRVMQDYPLPRLGWYVMGFAALVAPYADAIPESALSAQDVYGQQYQLHRFVSDYYWGNVGVNDLGKVSYHLADGRYVLDLVGLSSLEAARQTTKSDAWVEEVLRRHDVGLVFGYLPSRMPVGWTYLGQICLIRTPVTMAPCVDFVSTKPKEADEMKKRFAAFAATLPKQTQVVFPKP